MGRWLLLLLTAACLMVGPTVRCAQAAETDAPAAPAHSCCDPHPNDPRLPAAPCWSMACCVLFAAPVPRLTVAEPAPCDRISLSDVPAPETHVVRPPTPPPRAAGIA